MKRIVGIGGTRRAHSSSELMVRAVLDGCRLRGATTEMFDGQRLAALPHFNAEEGCRTAAEAELVAAVRRADGIVIGTPGYHGGVSGLVKNAIDLLEDIRGDARPYFEGRAVGLIVSAAGWQAGGITLAALRGIVHAMRGWPTPLGITINSVAQKPFAADGALADPAIAGQIDLLASQIMAFSLAEAA